MNFERKEQKHTTYNFFVNFSIPSNIIYQLIKYSIFLHKILWGSHTIFCQHWKTNKIFLKTVFVNNVSQLFCFLYFNIYLLVDVEKFMNDKLFDTWHDIKGVKAQYISYPQTLHSQYSYGFVKNAIVIEYKVSKRRVLRTCLLIY